MKYDLRKIKLINKFLNIFFVLLISLINGGYTKKILTLLFKKSYNFVNKYRVACFVKLLTLYSFNKSVNLILLFNKYEKNLHNIKCLNH